jgi:hypothetical protein
LILQKGVGWTTTIRMLGAWDFGSLMRIRGYQLCQ